MLTQFSLFKSSSLFIPMRVLALPLFLVVVSGSSLTAGFVHLSRLAEQNNGNIMNVSPTSSSWVAAQFRVGPEIPGTTLSELRLIVEQGVTESTSLSSLIVAVFTDKAGVPDQDLTPGSSAFTNSGLITGTGVARFTSNIPLTLSASQFYWLVLRPLDNPSAQPIAAQWPAMQAPAAWPLPGQSDSVWNLAAIPAGMPAINVPEPSSELLGVAAAMLVGLLVHRRKPFRT